MQMKLIIVFLILSISVFIIKTSKIQNQQSQFFTETFASTVPTMQSNGCPCGQPECPPCILAKTAKQIHERAVKEAKSDQETQTNLSKEADLQGKLFAQAQKYAQDVVTLEDRAKALAVELQSVSSQAQVARNKMIRAEQQAKQIAMKAINTMTIHPPHFVTNTPELHVVNTGHTFVNHVVQNEPQYQLTIGNTDASGFHDETTQAIQQEGGFDLGQLGNEQQQQGDVEQITNIPDSIEEANIQNEMSETSSV